MIKPTDIVTREYFNLRDLACVDQSFYLLQLASYTSTGHRLVYAHNVALNNVKKNNQRLVKNNRGNRQTPEAIYINDKVIYTTPNGSIYTIEEFFEKKVPKYRVTAPSQLQGIAGVGMAFLIVSMYNFTRILRKGENLKKFFSVIDDSDENGVKSFLSKLRKANILEYTQRVLCDQKIVQQNK